MKATSCKYNEYYLNCYFKTCVVVHVIVFFAEGVTQRSNWQLEDNLIGQIEILHRRRTGKLSRPMASVSVVGY